MTPQAPRDTTELSLGEVHEKSWAHSRGLKIATSVGIVLGLSAGSFLVAGAATGGSAHRKVSAPQGRRGTPPVAFGKVASVGTTSFTITTKTGTDTVNVSSSTTYLERGVTNPTLANVTVGEGVAVFGTLNAGVVTATSVAIANPGGWGGHGAPPAGRGFGRGPGHGSRFL
jgi:hypothetical protein